MGAIPPSLATLPVLPGTLPSHLGFFTTLLVSIPSVFFPCIILSLGFGTSATSSSFL